MLKALFNPWVLLILVGSLAGTNFFTWWQTSGYEQNMCLSRVRLANQTVQAAQDRLAERISSESFVRAVDRSQKAKVSDRAYGDVLTLAGRHAVDSCNMPTEWWVKIHEIY